MLQCVAVCVAVCCSEWASTALVLQCASGVPDPKSLHQLLQCVEVRVAVRVAVCERAPCNLVPQIPESLHQVLQYVAVCHSV